jgi:hypothetical protein
MKQQVNITLALTLWIDVSLSKDEVTTLAEARLRTAFAAEIVEVLHPVTITSLREEGEIYSGGLEPDSPASEPCETDILDLLAKRQQIAVIWSVEDVQENRPDLSDDEAWEVLQAVKHDHDCNYGITWDTLEMTASNLFPEPPTSEAAAEA